MNARLRLVCGHPTRLMLLFAGLACACQGDASGASSTSEPSETSDGSETSVSSETETETGDTSEPDPDDCWVSVYTHPPAWDAVRLGPAGALVWSSAGLMTEAQDWVLEPALSEANLGNAFVDLIGTPEDLWLLDFPVAHWDGEALSYQEVEGALYGRFEYGADGSLWWPRDYCSGGCTTRVMELDTQTNTWLEIPQAPEPGDATSFAAGAGEQWLLYVKYQLPDALYHRTQGAWEPVALPTEELGERSELLASADGELWIASPDHDVPTRLYHRTAAGEWSEGEAPNPEGYDQLTAALNSEGLYLVHFRGELLWRWDPSLAEAELVTELPPGWQPVLHGYGERLLIEEEWNGPTLLELDAQAETLDPIFDQLSAQISAGSSGGPGSAYVVNEGSILRWEDEAWSRVHDIGRVFTYREGFADVWADGPDSAWTFYRTPSSGNDPGRTQLWRVEGQDASPSGPLLEGVEFGALWGRSPDEVWAIDELGPPWRYDGQSWSEQPLPPGIELVGAQAISGHAEALYILDRSGQVLHFADETWTQLPSVPVPDGRDIWGSLVATEGLLLASYTYDLADNPNEDDFVRRLEVWDGESWQAGELLWPDVFNPSGQRLTSDLAGGAWAQPYGPGEPKLLHLSEGSWEPVEPPEQWSSEFLIPTPGGLLLHPAGSQSVGYTSELRSECG